MKRREKGFYPLPAVPPPLEQLKPLEVEPVEPEPGVYLDTGPELPETYDLDIVRLLVQDPYRIYVFWELSGKGSDRARNKAKLMGFVDGKLSLQITRFSDGNKTLLDVEGGKDWWLLGDPGTEYMAEVGFAFNGVFFTIATSNRVRTPPVTLAEADTIAPPTPAQEELAVEVLKASGYEPVTIAEVREQVTERVREKRELTPRERIFIERLPQDLKEAVLAQPTAVTPESLRRIVWAMPRFLMLGSERVQVPQSLLEWLAWPGLPLEWPTSR
ncbi:MAG: DUF4912 domain-containing protein [Acidobacteria bacterium]|nr:DUF4912 domain-containing protein [Acidobacteriota bacterium]